MPTASELFTAERGVGAWLNGEPMKVSKTETILESLLVTGFPYDVHETPEKYLKRVRRLHLPRPRRPPARLGGDRSLLRGRGPDGRVLGGAACSRGTRCAGGLIVQEAGGRVTALDGRPWVAADGHILASNGLLHEQMMQILKEAAPSAP